METKLETKRKKLFDDLMLEILIKLPPKSLHRFRCASKSWVFLVNSISPSPTTNENKHNKLLILYEKQYSFLDCCNINNATSSCSGAPVPVRDSFVNIASPFDISWGELNRAMSVASCDGWLVLLIRRLANSKTFLFYPSLGQYTELPSCGYDGFDYTCGICKDSLENSYMVVSILRNPYNHETSYYSVFSLTTGSWTKLSKPVPLCISKNDAGVTVNGIVHWVGYLSSRSDRPRVVCYDVKQDAFAEMEVPSYGSCVDYDEFHLADMGGNLFLYFDIDGMLDLWEMKAYGVAESWRKMFRIEEGMGKCYTLRPLAFTKTAGEVVMMRGGNSLVIYNVKENTFETIRRCKTTLDWRRVATYFDGSEHPPQRTQRRRHRYLRFGQGKLAN